MREEGGASLPPPFSPRLTPPQYIFGYNTSVALAAVHTAVGLLDGWPEDGVAGMWLSGLAVERVHTTCFHNHAESVEVGDSLFSFFPLRYQHWRAQPCTPSSLLIHYMTPMLWDRVDETGLLTCGELDWKAVRMAAAPLCSVAGYQQFSGEP